jgi:hypothetical protein
MVKTLQMLVNFYFRANGDFHLKMALCCFRFLIHTSVILKIKHQAQSTIAQLIIRRNIGLGKRRSERGLHRTVFRFLYPWVGYREQYGVITKSPIDEPE